MGEQGPEAFVHLSILSALHTEGAQGMFVELILSVRQSVTSGAKIKKSQSLSSRHSKSVGDVDSLTS